MFGTVTVSVGIIFLKFLQATSTFKTSVINTSYTAEGTISTQCKNSEVYLSFMCLAAQDIEAFL